MPTIYQDEYVTLRQEIGQGFVVSRRTRVPFTTAADLQGSFDGQDTALAEVNAARQGMLFDIRMAPRTNDPEIERLLVERSMRITARFARSALLLLSPVGREQVGRLREGVDGAPAVFDDEVMAEDYVAGR